MSDRTPRERLERKAAVGIVHDDRGKVREMKKWLSEITDVRDDVTIGAQILGFIQRHQVRSVVVGAEILGCPHEEGIDYALRGTCPQCPYWAGRVRPI